MTDPGDGQEWPDLSLAGLYEWWPDPEREKDVPERWLWSAAITTCAATGPAGEIHDRTPVILPEDRIDAWLDPTLQDPGAIAEVLAGIQPPPLGIRAVSRAVNNVRNDGPEFVAPLKVDAGDQAIQLNHGRVTSRRVRALFPETDPRVERAFVPLSDLWNRCVITVVVVTYLTPGG